MYIKSVSIENLKGFESLEFNFQRPDNSFEGWTVITGDNGTGKSTLLKAIVMAYLGKDRAIALTGSYEEIGLIRQKELGMSIIIDILYKSITNLTSNDFSVEFGFILKTGKHFELNNEDFYKNLDEAEESLERISDSRHKIKTELIDLINSGERNILAYGPYRRLYGESSSAKDLMKDSLYGRFVSLFKEDSSLILVEEWLKDLRYEEKDEAYLFHLIKFLNQNFLTNEYQIQFHKKEAIVIENKAGVALDWKNMSDGYRTALALACDIIRQFSKGKSKDDLFKEVNNEWLFTASGVVLIDEIDAHLHPEWQQKIGFWFKKYFPNIQFIVTSHSPFICQAADENGLFVLPDPSSNEKPRMLSKEEWEIVVNSRAGDIYLTELFGLKQTISEEAMKLKEHYNLLFQKQLLNEPMSVKEKKEYSHLTYLFANTGK